MMHMPVIPREEFKGKTGQGDWADSLSELDSDRGLVALYRQQDFSYLSRSRNHP
jgi:hypothetical protein